MSKKEKFVKTDKRFDKLAERVAQTDSNEVVQISKENIQDETIDDLLKKFEGKARQNENGVEFWYARDLQVLFEYELWQNFQKIVNKAKQACKTSKKAVDNHFIDVNKMVKIGSNTSRTIQDYKLTRYACYLIAQNGDPRKKPVAFAQTYFAVQTRRQEIQDIEIRNLTEDEKRVKLRNEIKGYNKSLSSVAHNFGVIEPLDYAKFQNAGYKGLYGEEAAKDIVNRKGLKKKDDILDHMGSEELAANWFRVTQTEAQLKKDNIHGRQHANKTHYKVGQRVRNTMVNKPEDLPTPSKSIKQLEKEQKKALKNKKINKLK